jgi:hypothetical protein
LKEEIVSGIIDSVQGTNPGPASGITYTIKINTDAGPILIPGVRPCNQRPADDVDIRVTVDPDPEKRTKVLGVKNGEYYEFMIIEQQDYAECP